MKFKVLSVVVMIGLVFASCGSQPSIEGDNLINKARSDYKKLDSAKVIMTNTDTNEVEQTFEFKYDEKGFLTYSYFGKTDEEVYAQYNNGVESFTYDDGKFEHLQKGDKDFAVYSRDVTHPQADEGLIIFTPKAVKTAEKKVENGATHIHHIYDVEKLEQENLKAFETDYYFDKNDELLYFIETSELESDGKTSKHSYKVEITEKNNIKQVDNTCKNIGDEIEESPKNNIKEYKNKFEN